LFGAADSELVAHCRDEDHRRRSASRGKLFYRLAQQAVQVDPAPFATLIKPLPIGSGGVK